MGPRVGFAVVAGRSMEPTLCDGDLLLVGWGMPVRPGRLALVRLPEGPDGPRVLAVKRVTGRDPGDATRWWVERDNPREGVDSWLVGGIPDTDVCARVLFRVPRRLGRLARVAGSRPPFGMDRLG
ncbi:MAG: S24/S26 family peptidase [Dermatophilaceae bacterium]